MDDSSKRVPVKFDDEIFLTGDVYYYRGTPPGSKKQLERSLKIKKGAAQKDVLKAKRDVISGLSNVGVNAVKNSFSVLAKAYVKGREEEAKNPENLSKQTFKECELTMRLHLIPYFGNKRVDEITFSDFSEYCLFKSKKEKINLVNHRKVFNHFFKDCVQQGFIKYFNPFQIPKAAQKPRRQREVLTNEEVGRLVHAIMELAKEEAHFRKTRLYVMFYLFMGMRNMEICKLRWDEVDLEKQALKINKNNNRRRKERAIPINSYCLIVLKEEFALKSTEWVFPSAKRGGRKPYMDPSGSYRKGWIKALERAEITRHITPHDLRSTFETFMHTNINLTDTQREKMAGASIDVQKNTYVTMNVERLREAAESVVLPEIQKIFRENARGKRQKKDSSVCPTKRKYSGKKAR